MRCIPLFLLVSACRASPSPIVDVSPPPPSATLARSAEPAPSSAPEPAPAPTASPSAAPSAEVREIVELRAPASAWKPAEPERAMGYVSFFFGAHVLQDRGHLRPLAAWRKGERGRIAVYRRVAPASGEPVVAEATGHEAPEPKKLPSGALWYELPSDGTQFYWVTSGSLVIEASDEIHAARALAAVFRPWTLEVVKTLSTPRLAP